ncbi:MAG: hypothetical protein WED07_16100 [Candidatus Freyarchaeum deiterrae]
MSSQRPMGITALAIIFLILATLGIIAGILVAAVVVPTFQNTLQNDFLSIFFSFGITPMYIYAQSAFLLDILGATQLLSSIGAYQFIAVGALIGSVLHILDGVGLLYMKKWAYYLALILGISGIIAGVIGIISIQGIMALIAGVIIVMYLIFALIFGIIIVVYLMVKIKHEFE